MVDMEQIKGKINQAAGELTDDHRQILKGHIQEATGKDSGNESLKELSGTIDEKIEEYKRKNEENSE